MSDAHEHPAVAALAEAVARDGVHTVRICFPDHYGTLRGRRVAAARFLEATDAPQAFCDGALVWDIRCDIFEETDFSNYRTGYPDLYVRPDVDTLRRCGWSPGEWLVLGDARDHHGHALEVSPRWVLRRVLERIGAPARVGARLELRVPDDAVAAAWAPGRPAAFADQLLRGGRESDLGICAIDWSRPRRVMTLTFGERDALSAADAIALARTAVRELTLSSGVRATAMPRLAADDVPTLLELHFDAPEGEGFPARLEDMALLLRPLPLAHPGAPACGELSGGRARARAASDANPHLALAGALIAAHGDGSADPDAPGRGYRAAIGRFRGAGWAADWLAPMFVHDTLALAEREADLRDAAISGWDRERYWECG